MYSMLIYFLILFITINKSFIIIVYKCLIKNNKNAFIDKLIFITKFSRQRKNK